jgi:hypothetical protein
MGVAEPERPGTAADISPGWLSWIGGCCDAAVAPLLKDANAFYTSDLGVASR